MHPPRPVTRHTAALATGLLLLTGCANRDAGPTPAGTTSPSRSTSPTAPATTPTTARKTPTRSTTTTLLPGMPLPTATSPAGIDSSAVHGVGDLPKAFQCSPVVDPIVLPAKESAPEGRICSSKIADDEALFLFYYATPEQKLAALTTAMALAKYVHAGPNWVAGGTVSPAMGRVGGEVYK